MNASKTKWMNLSREEKVEEKILRTAQGDVVEKVNDFVYLGSNISADGSLTSEIKRRCALAVAASKKLDSLWKDRNVTYRVKIRVMQTCVLSVLLYGLEAAPLRKVDIMKLEAVQSKILRKIARVKWNDYVTNEEVRRRLGCEIKVEDWCEVKRLRWYGHCLRMSDDRMVKRIMMVSTKIKDLEQDHQLSGLMESMAVCRGGR